MTSDTMPARLGALERYGYFVVVVETPAGGIAYQALRIDHRNGSADFTVDGGRMYPTLGRAVLAIEAHIQRELGGQS